MTPAGDAAANAEPAIVACVDDPYAYGYARAGYGLDEATAVRGASGEGVADARRGWADFHAEIDQLRRSKGAAGLAHRQMLARSRADARREGSA